MSKMKELATVLDNLVACGETLISTANALKEIFSDDTDASDDTGGTLTDQIWQDQNNAPADAPASKSKKKAPAKSYTKEQVRGILAAKSGEGHSDEVRALLAKYGAKQLKQVDPKDYTALIAEAEKIGGNADE